MRKNTVRFGLVLAVAGMMYLDVLAQEKGFLPMADSAWTLVPHLETSSKNPKSKARNS